MEKLTADLEKSRELERVIVHVDMDAFYAAVEMRDCPELKEKPMAVGSMSMLVRILVRYILHPLLIQCDCSFLFQLSTKTPDSIYIVI